MSYTLYDNSRKYLEYHLESYHGTSPNFIKDLVAGKIDLTLGGGELGAGFYTGEHLFEAKAWAYNKHSKSKSVLALNVPDSEVCKLDIKLLDSRQAAGLRKRIRGSGGTRSYQLEVDLVWAPIVGTVKATGNQFKWESQYSGTLINSDKVTRVET